MCECRKSKKGIHIDNVSMVDIAIPADLSKLTQYLKRFTNIV